MNYDALIYQMIESLKADKSIPSEYRNGVISSGRRWQCEIRGVRTLARLEAPQDAYKNEMSVNTFLSGETIAGPSTQATATQSGSCICTPGMPARRDCPMHKGVA